MNYFYFCNPFSQIVNKKIKTGNLLQISILAFGLLAIGVHSSDYLIQEKIEEGIAVIKKDSEERETESENQILYLPYFLASVQSFQIDPGSTLNLLFDIPFVTEIKVWFENTPEFRSCSFFKILFQNIISPNAP